MARQVVTEMLQPLTQQRLGLSPPAKRPQPVSPMATSGTGCPVRANPVADRQDGLQVVAIHHARHRSAAFGLNYSEFRIVAPGSSSFSA